MKLTGGQIHDAWNALRTIAAPGRHLEIPQMAKYRLARMKTALDADYILVENQRSAAVMELGHETFADEEKTKSTGWGVDPGTPQFDEYVKRWNAIRGEMHEVNVQPITLASLGDHARGIEAHEFELLGDLVIDTVPGEETK